MGVFVPFHTPEEKRRLDAKTKAKAREQAATPKSRRAKFTANFSNAKRQSSKRDEFGFDRLN